MDFMELKPIIFCVKERLSNDLKNPNLHERLVYNILFSAEVEITNVKGLEVAVEFNLSEYYQFNNGI